MTEDLEKKLNNLFEAYSFLLSCKKNIKPTYFLTKGTYIVQVENAEKLRSDIYFNYVKHYASKINADGIILISENNVVVSNESDVCIEGLTNGTLKVEDHPDKTSYLILAYVSNTGENKALFGKIEKDPTGRKYITNQEWATDVSVVSYKV